MGARQAVEAVLAPAYDPLRTRARKKGCSAATRRRVGSRRNQRNVGLRTNRPYSALMPAARITLPHFSAHDAIGCIPLRSNSDCADGVKQSRSQIMLRGVSFDPN